MSSLNLENLRIELTHINTRKQIVEGDAKRLAVDLAISVRPLLEGMDQVLRVILSQVGSFPAKVLDTLIANNHGMADQTFRADFENHVIDLNDGVAAAVSLTDAKVNKFKMDWVDLALTFRIQTFVNADQYGLLGQLLEDELMLSARPATASMVVTEAA